MKNAKEEKYMVSDWKKYKSIDGIPESIVVEIKGGTEEVKLFDVDIYAGLYYLQNNYEGTNCNLQKRVNGACEWVENQIYNDCKKEIWNCKDVFRILAWKAGKINHRACLESKNIIIYDKNWDEGKDNGSIQTLQMPYQRVIDEKEFNTFADEIIKIRQDYYTEKKSPNEVWENLLKISNDKKTKIAMNGIGTVYLITLLHFITNGEYPIYDRFAMAALVVLQLKKLGINVPVDSIIRIGGLPDKSNEGKVKDILNANSEYGKYWTLLRTFFPDEKWKDRKVDQALWVYGHLYRVQ